jgi:hypothetical protein
MSDTKRTDYATQDDLHPNVYQAMAASAFEDDQAPPAIQAVPVIVENVVLTRGLSAQHSTHVTYVFPPATAMMIAPEDNNRTQITIMFPTITGSTGFFVLCDSLEASQAKGNLAATAGLIPPTPAGTVLAMGQVFHENDNDVLYAVNTDPTSTLLLAVVMERAEIK